jgi:hypothetical protein
MDVRLFERLEREGLLSGDSLARIKSREKDRPVSVHWDLRTLLYFSVLLLTGGLGILLYKHIDTIGHATLVTLTGVLAGVCFYYCFKKCAPYSNGLVAAPNVWFDYILLLGCLLFLAFIGYLQYQYHVFGMRWGLATFIPMLFLFFCAYYFDHKGVLGLAIANLAAWMDISIAPLQLIRVSNIEDENTIVNGIILGILLHFIYLFSERTKIKPHFGKVYKNIGVQVLFISLFVAMAEFSDWYLFWFAVMMGMVAYHMKSAIAEKSFYFLVLTVIYGYCGVSYVVIRLLSKLGYEHELAAYCIIIYFIASGIALVRLLMRFNRQLK